MGLYGNKASKGAWIGTFQVMLKKCAM